MNEFDRFSSEEHPPELLEIEELLRTSPQPEVPEGLLDTLLSHSRTQACLQVGTMQQPFQVVSEQPTAKHSLAEQRRLVRNTSSKRSPAYVAILIVALGGVACLWPLFQTESPDHAEVTDVPHDNTLPHDSTPTRDNAVVAHFSQETDPCFILPQ